MRSGIIFVLALLGCDKYCQYGSDNYKNITNYNITITNRTPNGIGVDSTNQPVDLADIDRRTDEVEECLSNMFPGGVLPQNIVKDSFCSSNSFDPIIHRDCIQVKIPLDWYYGCEDEKRQHVGPGYGEQVFPCEAPASLCMAKGFTPTPECPCACRAIIQDNKTIVTAPNMHLYKSELIRLITSCNNIWTSDPAKCWTAE